MISIRLFFVLSKYYRKFGLTSAKMCYRCTLLMFKNLIWIPVRVHVLLGAARLSEALVAVPNWQTVPSWKIANSLQIMVLPLDAGNCQPERDTLLHFAQSPTSF